MFNSIYHMNQIIFNHCRNLYVWKTKQKKSNDQISTVIQFNDQNHIQFSHAYNNIEYRKLKMFLGVLN